MRGSRIVAAVLAATLGVAMAGPAWAKKDEGRHHDDDRDHDDDRGHASAVDVDVDVNVVFSPHQRTEVREYWVEKHGRGHCPPGLAKKHNGCMPPGLAKKRYHVGHPVDASIVVFDIPADLRVRIGPPPRGYRYGLIDGDLVKLAVGTYLVVDAIDGLVN